MRTILVLSALVLGAAASAAPPQSLPSEPQLPSAAVLKGPLEKSPAAGSSQPNCRGRIETARAQSGLPKLDSAKAGEPLFIATVDRLIDGCEVLVMRNNLSDIRPLPEFRDDPVKLTPLGGQ